MKTTKHTIGDLIEIYGLLLSYVGFDSDYRDCDTAECDEDSCPKHLSERGQNLYDDRRLWHLLKAAPDLLEACKAVKSAADNHEELAYPILEKVIPTIAKAA